MKNLVIVAMLVLSFGIVAAHDVGYGVLYGHDSGEPEKFDKTYYFDDEGKVASKMTWFYYDAISLHENLYVGNDKRHSIKDYRHGYSYRATGDYFEDKRTTHNDMFSKKKSYVLKKDLRSYYGSGLKGYRYDYAPHLGTYEKRECYVTAPANKLFYIKC